MRNEIIQKLMLLFALISSSKSVSQIYFSSNSSLYARNEVFYVQQNIHLEPNSAIYLRTNSQLVQGTSTASANTGSGNLSVYQEGTSDNFDYNYWCSPVGLPGASTGNTNFGITMLNSPQTAINSNAAIILPAGSYDGIASPLSIASSWIYKLVNANNYSQWVFVGSASTLAPGEGFTMKGTSGTDSLDPDGLGVSNNPGGAQRYDFRGRPNDGNINVTLGANSSTLTGNPYPSTLHLNAFLLDPANSTLTGGTAYFWQEDKTVNSHYLSAYRGGYGSYAPINTNSEGIYMPPVFRAYNQDGTVNPGPGSGSGAVVARRYAPIGQGFLLNGTTNGTAVFKNSHRVFVKEVLGNSQFEKKLQASKNNEESEPEPLSYIKLNAIINNEFPRQLALAFLPEATDGPDVGIDALNLTSDLPSDVNFWLQDAGYLIQGVNFDVEKKIPLVVKAAAETTLRFSIPAVINFDASQPVYLYDTADSSYHEIKNGTYEVTIAPGTYSDRFKIAFKNQTLGIPENLISENFIIYQDNISRILKASNPNAFSVKSFALYDMTGKAILLKKDLKNDINFSFSTSGLSQGVYIAEFITEDNQKFTKKVIISNSGK